MKKPKNKNKSDPTNPIDEFNLEWNQGTEYPDSLFEIEGAVLIDLRRLLLTFAENAAEHADMAWITTEGFQETEFDRIGELLNSIVKRKFLEELLGEDHFTHEYYKRIILDIAVSHFISSLKAITLIDLGVEHAVRDVQNYIFHLMLKGDMQKSFDIAKFTGSLKCVQNPDRDGVIKINTSRCLHIEFRQYKILKALIKFLIEGKLPSKKALRLQCKMREEDFSETIKIMEIFPLLPNSANKGAPTGGTVHELTPIFKNYQCFNSRVSG